MGALREIMLKTGKASQLILVERTVWFLGLVGIVFSFYAISIGFDNTIFDFHGFRQAQTAISTDMMLHGGVSGTTKHRYSGRPGRFPSNSRCTKASLQA